MIDYAAFLSRTANRMQESAIRKMGTVLAEAADVISFAPGYPSPEMFPWDDLREIVSSLLAAREPATLQYGRTRGFKPLLDEIAGLMSARGIHTHPDELVLSTGSQQALDLVARVLLDEGEAVVVERPAYTGAITAFRNALATPIGVRQEPDGIDLDDLERVLAEQRSKGRPARLIYVIPNFQNPTGLLTARSTRTRLLEIASRHNLLIVEDDPYGDLFFDDGGPQPETRSLKADDEDGRVIYLSTVSKTLAPGLRVAWMVAPAALASKLEVAKQAADICTGALDQRIVHEACRRSVLARQLPRLRAHYQAKRDVMTGTLRQELGGLLRWAEPRGGFFVWVSLPEGIDAERMLERALARRVIYVAGNAFFVEPAGPPNTMRLSFSAPPGAQIAEGVKRLAGVIREELNERDITATPREPKERSAAPAPKLE